MRLLTTALLLSLMVGCIPERTHNSNTYDCSPVFDYAGTYGSHIEGSSGDETWENEFDVVVQQNGPALAVANILALADAEGLTFDSSFDQLDYWINGGEHQRVTYSGGSRPGEPFVLDLNILVEYPNLDGWDREIDYVISLNTALTF